MKQIITSLLLITIIISMMLATACTAGDIQGVIDNTKVQLAVPTNLRVDESTATLMWNSVEHASGYTVCANETTYTTATNSFALQNLKDGEYTISVMANGDGAMYISSAYSDTINYTRRSDSGNVYEDVIGAFGSFDEINTKNSFLGYGIDIINASAITSKNILMTYPIFDMDKLMNEKLLKSNEHYNTFASIEGSTIEMFSDSMSHSSSVTAGTNVSAKGNIYGVDGSASVSLSGGLSTSFTKTSDSVESQYFLQIVAENQNYWLVLQTSEQRYKDILSEEFKKDLYNTAFTPAQLFEKYGTHLLTSVAMGGNICMYYTMYSYEAGVSFSEYAEVSSELKTNVEAAYGSYSGSAGAEMSFESAFGYQNTARTYGIQIDKKIVSAGGGSFGINNETTLYENYFDWQKSLDAYPVVIGIKDTNSLYPIWNLLDLSVEGAVDRYNELYAYFCEYGESAYNKLCETYEIAPKVSPTGITNINVGAIENYNEGEIIQVKAGDTMNISFDVLPSNSNRYTKTFVSNNTGAIEVDPTGALFVKNNAPADTYVIVTIGAGAISKQITFYIANTYNVTFNTGFSDVEVAPIIGVKAGYMISEPQVYKEGYYIDGWYKSLDLTEKFDFDIDRVTSHLTLYAKWVKIKPIVSFETGLGSAIDSQQIEYNGTAVEPHDPSRTGYTFGGWFIDKECTESFDFKTMLRADTTLYAKWNKIIYTVKFESNGGTPVADVTTGFEYGYKISEPELTKTYYTFVAWYKDPNFSQRFYFDTEITSDITLYAKWTPINTTVKFVDFDGVGYVFDAYGNAIDDCVANIDSEFKVSAPDAYKEGYTFNGWYLNGKKIDLDSYDKFKPNDNGYILCASWTVNEYTVTYMLNGKTYATEKYNFGESITTLNVNVEGYDFSGWKLEVGDIFATMPAYDITVHGTLTAIEYFITYYVDGSLYYTSDAYHYGDKIAYIAEPHESGRSFSGWTYSGGILPEVMPAENIEILGNFDAILCTISYYLNGELVHTDSVYALCAIPEYDLSRVGYTFDGWYDEDGKIIPAIMPENDINAYGTLVINQYTIAFDTLGGSPIAPITLDYGQNIATVANPEKTGYTFTGWNKDIPQTMPAENMTITATWQINKYNITFFDGLGNEIYVDEYKDIEYDSPISVPAGPIVTGYIFAGWDIEIPSNMPAYDFVVTAKMNPNIHTLRFELTTGNMTEVVFEADVAFGTLITVPAVATVSGYTFNGWGTVPTTMPDGDVIIKAKRMAIDYTVTFDINTDSKTGNFTMSENSQKATYAITSTLINTMQSAAGYEFIGWAVDKDGSVMVAESNGKFLTDVSNYTDSEGRWIHTDSVTLYAQWRAKTFTVTYDSNGGSCSSASAVVTYDSKYSLPTPTRANYAFTGWYLDEIEIFDEDQITTAADHTLIAGWVKVSYTVELRGGGTGDKKITDSDGVYDHICPGFDKEALIAEGYTKIKISINRFDVYENDWGYQQVWVTWDKDKNGSGKIISKEYESPLWEWKSYSFSCTTSINGATSDINFWIEYGARGDFSDDWTLGYTSISVTAVK